MGPPLLPAHPVRFRCIWTQKHICPVGCQNSTILLELSELCIGSPQHPHLYHPLNPPPAGKRPKLKGTSLILEPCQSRTRRQSIMFFLSQWFFNLNVQRSRLVTGLTCGVLRLSCRGSGSQGLWTRSLSGQWFSNLVAGWNPETNGCSGST